MTSHGSKDQDRDLILVMNNSSNIIAVFNMKLLRFSPIIAMSFGFLLQFLILSIEILRTHLQSGPKTDDLTTPQTLGCTNLWTINASV